MVLEPLRILQVVTIMNRGGLETMLMNYYRQIDRSKIQFDFMVHRAERGDYDDEIESLGGKIFRMPQIRPGNYQKYFTLLEQFFTVHTGYRVVHSHINENSSFVLRAAKRAGVPCRIAHSHTSDLGLDIKFPFRLYARMVMKDQPNEYFACSRRAGEWLFGKKVLNSKELTILKNAINVEEFKFNEETRKQLRKELGLENKLVIGHIGRFNKSKNHEFLIDIFKAVQTGCPEAVLMMVGDGQLRSKIEKKVQRLGLISHVKFLGLRSDISKLLQVMDVFVFPSFFEGLPVVMVEAQAAGLRCIVSDSITRETDFTGRVDFISLNESSEKWASIILSSSVEREDTSEILHNNGYDTAYMSNWLADYYTRHAFETKNASC